jgi:branched-subunit amino acid aminotransferase/4-amino-4-deoxychorismate lyase
VPGLARLVGEVRALRVEVDGREVSAGEAWSIAGAFGHFTAMQVRGGATRGLDLHLARLAAANRELFDAPLDGDRIRALIRHALDGTADASVRVHVYERDPEPALVVTVREPAGVTSPMRLCSVRFQRPDAHLKHFATGAAFYSRLARRRGFDDGLLAADDGTISESATANVGFWDGTGVVWPEAPQLRGITMQLLERHLPGAGIASRSMRVGLEDLSSFAAAFVTSARGVAVVGAIDDVRFPADPDVVRTVSDVYAAVPWDPI